MDDDFNTSSAAGVIFDFVREVNKLIDENDKINSQFYQDALKFLKATAVDVLGIIDLNELESETASSDDDWILTEIEKRTKAKLERNWGLADEIRNSLLEKGIILEDGKDGTTFKKK
jgi:cysteinyl-tRNA synthetase